MSSSFITALGGLRANQSWLDVIGNNLANSSTPGFKASRALFADQFSRLIRPSSPPSGSLGGTNPYQIGQGVKLAHVDHDMGQGALSATGRTFDLAMLGRGFFAMTDNVHTYFTRVGTFGLDADRNMIDQRTGFKVLDASGSPFTIDTDAIVPPQATTEMSFKGNLPATVTGPLAEVLAGKHALTEGSAASLTGGASEPFAIPIGETWTMELTINGGAPQEVSLTSTTGSFTAAEIADAINELDHVEATVDLSGAIQITSDKNGAQSSIKVTSGATGADLAGLLGLSTSQVNGSESAATGSTDLNALTLNLGQYAVGDEIQISGTDADGTQIAASFEYGVDGTTIDDFVAFLNGEFDQATASFDTTTQKLVLTADATGEASLSLAISDASGQVGKSEWAKNTMAVQTNGAGPDEVSATIEVYDAAGAAHLVSLEFERQDDGTWNANASVPAGEGSVLSGAITGITFNSDGTLSTPASASLSLQFNAQPAQTIAVQFGQAGGYDGITQFGSPASLIAADQDGFGVGELSTLSVDAEGVIQGFYSNGETRELGNFGVATFTNEQGLQSSGDNLWIETPNSGTRTLAAGKFGGAGEVVAGNLEESNVDTAEEFVRMIQAQRGFQSNARVITAQNELLEEIVNVV